MLVVIFNSAYWLNIDVLFKSIIRSAVSTEQNGTKDNQRNTIEPLDLDMLLRFLPDRRTSKCSHADRFNVAEEK